jgi:hypothetical protein
LDVFTDRFTGQVGPLMTLGAGVKRCVKNALRKPRRRKRVTRSCAALRYSNSKEQLARARTPARNQSGQPL